jgi:hypothetical protein
VTFSRKAIFGLKNEIEAATKFRCAVVYGALPPGKFIYNFINNFLLLLFFL